MNSNTDHPPTKLAMPDGRRISYIRLAPQAQGPKAQMPTTQDNGEGTARPELMWMGGFRSEMRGGKADALHEWCAAQGLGFTRFDYSGHGASEGRFEDGTISRWLEETETIFREVARGPQILVGSSMGAWLALLLMHRLVGRLAGSNEDDALSRIKGAVLIAPAWDMTERLMWEPAPDDIREELMETGVWHRPSAYDDQPYPITRALIEDGRKHLIGGTTFDPGCPVRILHGLKDADVPWQGSVTLMELLEADDVRLTLIKDGEHRLSRDKDLRLLERTIGELWER